jgi:hypothetical protein
MDDNKFRNLVGSASIAVIAGAAFVATGLLAGGGWLLWRHMAYQTAVKECFLGVSPLAVDMMNEAAVRYGGVTTSQCMAQKGFPQR